MHAHEHAGEDRTVVIGEQGAHLERPGRGIDTRRHEVELALMGIAILVLQAHVDRDLVDIGGTQAARAHGCADAQDGRLVQVEIDVDGLDLVDYGQRGRRR